MREFIGHTLKVIADNFPGPVEGVLVDDKPVCWLLKGSDGKIIRIIKSKISAWTPMDGETETFVPLHVLACENKKKACSGVQFIHDGQGFKRSDFDTFMSGCPCRSETCSFGTKGELRTVSGTYLRNMLAGTIFGNYPKGQGGMNGQRLTGSVGPVDESKSQGGRVDEGKPPVVGGEREQDGKTE